MGEIAQNFVTKFHEIEGVTIGERKRNLFHLLHSSHLDTQSQDFVISHLQPQSHLQRLFMVEFLIYHHRFEELFQEFVKGDEIVVSRISKQKWFFQKCFADVGPTFITQLFPSLSYSLKLKILKKITPILKEPQADEIFNALLQNYGIFIATNILTACSVDKIEQILKDHSVKIWNSQLKLLYDKNPDLVLLYLKEREKLDGNRKFMDHNPIFMYIAQKNPQLYYELYQKYNFKIKLGKRVTNNLIVAKRNDIVANPEIYVKNLNGARLVRKLGPDFKTVFFKLFPKRIEDSPSAESSRLLQYYPRKRQYNLMVTTYNQIFQRKLHQCPHLIDEYILKMITDADEREKLAKIKEEKDPDTYLIYYRTDRCIQAIKDRINFARLPYERAKLVGILTKTCFVNNDYNSLIQVVEFIFQRFKNDSKEVQIRFFHELIYGGCNFNNLTEEHWKWIQKILARPDFNQYDSHLLQEVCFRHIMFLHKVGKPLEEEILHFFGKYQFQSDFLGSFLQNPGAERLFLCTFIELAPRVYSPSTTIENLDCQLMLACKNYNQRNPKKSINICNYPRLIQSVKNALVDKINIENNALSAALELVVCTATLDEEIEEVVTLYWLNITDFGTPFAIKWFLRHRPTIIEKYFEAFLQFIISKRETNQDLKIWQNIKTYSHLNLDQKTLEFCHSKLNEESYENPEFLAKSLSVLMKPEEYLALLESYKPSCFKIDLQKDEINRRFGIQRNFLKETKNINLPVSALSLILQFCFEDYVSSCRSPLYSACYKAPQDQIKIFIDELNNRGNVSVKKHAFYLICALFDIQTVFNALRVCNLKQSVAITFKYFLRNPSDECWEIFKSKITELGEKDKTTIGLLVRKLYPKTYKLKCFETIWNFLEKTNYKKYKRLLLQVVQYDMISRMESKLFVSIIEDSFLLNPAMNKIVSKYLIYCQEQEKINLIFNYLEKNKTSKKLSSKSLNDFIYEFFKAYIEWNGENTILLSNVVAKFEQIYPPVKTLEENIMLTLLKFKNQNIDQFSKSIIELHNHLILKYGESFVGIFAECLRKLLPHFFKENSQMFQFYNLLLINKQSIDDVLLVIKLLPRDSEPEDKESFNYYNHTLLQLQEVNVPSVQLHLNLHFKFHKVCLDFEYYESVNSFCINSSSWLISGACRKVGYILY